MPRILTLVIVGGLIWYGWSEFQERRLAPPTAPIGEPRVERQQSIRSAIPREEPAQFSCDGRTRCSQMRSCAEASYFIKNCPNTEMDGDRDGVPCESQWCN